MTREANHTDQPIHLAAASAISIPYQITTKSTAHLCPQTRPGLLSTTEQTKAADMVEVSTTASGENEPTASFPPSLPRYFWYAGHGAKAKQNPRRGSKRRQSPSLWVGGEFTRSGGTSASTPISAAIINPINAHRLDAGKATLGLLNPALCAHPRMLNDVTNGTNPGCGTKGFSAVPGWDLTTGLGYVDLQMRREALCRRC